MKIFLLLSSISLAIQSVSACGRRSKSGAPPLPPPLPPFPSPAVDFGADPLAGSAFGAAVPAPVFPSAAGLGAQNGGFGLPAGAAGSLGIGGAQPRIPAALKQRRSDQGFLDSAAVISELLGPFDLEKILALSGGDSPVHNSRDLSCGFDAPCCWHNIAGGEDDLQWAVLTEQPKKSKALKQFQTEKLPKAPFAITGARKSHSYVYSFLVSCPIFCQQEEGTLKFKHWTSNEVTLDVCTLPLKSRNFSFCQTLTKNHEEIVRITIPPQDNPFVMVIVGSEFTKEEGGVAAVDDIEYFGSLCQPGERGGQRNDISGPQFDSVCDALHCDFQAGGERSLCKYQKSEVENTKQFYQSRSRTGNYAAGVPFANNKEFYLAADVKPGETGVVKSIPFNIAEDIRMSFDFFETADDVSMSICLDELNKELECYELSPNQAFPHHRRWRRDFVTIRRGENRVVSFLAENSGYNHASVGLSRIRLLDNFGSNIKCQKDFYDTPVYGDGADLKLVQDDSVLEEYYNFEKNFEKQ